MSAEKDHVFHSHMSDWHITILKNGDVQVNRYHTMHNREPGIIVPARKIRLWLQGLQDAGENQYSIIHRARELNDEFYHIPDDDPRIAIPVAKYRLIHNLGRNNLYARVLLRIIKKDGPSRT